MHVLLDALLPRLRLPIVRPARPGPVIRNFFKEGNHVVLAVVDRELLVAFALDDLPPFAQKWT